MTDVDVPLWANILIYMTMYQYYLLGGILPTFYLVIVKLFGFPLLQRWSNEVVISLYPNKVKFGKIVSQLEPNFHMNKGTYWPSSPLQPVEFTSVSPKVQVKLAKIKERYDFLNEKQTKTKKEEKELESLLKQQAKLDEKKITVSPVNQLHIFTHAVNQEVFDMKRKDTKLDDLLEGEHKIKPIKGHGIWIMRNFLLHFNRHFKIIIGETGELYQLRPVKEKQQFSVNFFHTLGVELLVEEKTVQEGETSDGGGTRLVTTQITNSVVRRMIKHGSENQNYSAGYAYRLAKHLGFIESNWHYWITGSFNPMLIVVLGGAAAAIALVMFLLHGGSPSGLGPMPK